MGVRSPSAPMAAEKLINLVRSIIKQRVMRQTPEEARSPPSNQTSPCGAAIITGVRKANARNRRRTTPTLQNPCNSVHGKLALEDQRRGLHG